MNFVLIKNLILINMWSIRILTFIYVCFLSIKATAQEIPNDIPLPTVASLAKFGDIPVSMFTGTSKITIPIFELKSLEKSMPISLDYDASGFQINALPSCQVRTKASKKFWIFNDTVLRMKYFRNGKQIR